MQGFRDRFNRLCRQYPRIARGGLTVSDLRDLARRLARRAGLEVHIAFCAWPWPGTVQRLGDTLVVTVDDRQNPGLRKFSLAHEVAHLGLGHYRLDDFWTDAHGVLSREEDREADLFAAVVLNPHASPVELLGREQLDWVRDGRST